MRGHPYRRGGHVETVGATSADLEAADRFQNELGEGPCLESIERDDVIHVADLTSDERWLRWGRPVAEQLGFRSVLSANMMVQDREIGALNVYARSAHAFTRDDVEQAPFFAAHAAAAIASVRKAEQLRQALTTRVLIGQAEGILMERFEMTADQAFAYLARLSQHRNEKLRDLAAGIIDSRTIPDHPTVELETTSDGG